MTPLLAFGYLIQTVGLLIAIAGLRETAVRYGGWNERRWIRAKTDPVVARLIRAADRLRGRRGGHVRGSAGSAGSAFGVATAFPPTILVDEPPVDPTDTQRAVEILDGRVRGLTTVVREIRERIGERDQATSRELDRIAADLDREVGRLEVRDAKVALDGLGKAAFGLGCTLVGLFVTFTAEWLAACGCV